LEQQLLRVFQYETYRDSIPAGADIDDACRREIQRARFCFVVISPSSVTSSWSRNEVVYALSLQRRDFIFPVILLDEERLHSKLWLHPYDILRTEKALLRITDLKTRNTSAVEGEVEKALMQFCADHVLKYFPPATDLPRLPLRQRLHQEIWGRRSLDRSRKAQTLEEIFAQCGVFLTAYAEHNLEGANLEIQQLIRRTEREFPESRLYYPYIGCECVRHAGKPFA
jgi:hypothetical protein